MKPELDTQPNQWHTLEIPDLLHSLNSNPENGLDATEVEQRLNLYGKNKLSGRQSRTPITIIIDQLTNPLVLLLIGAASLSLILGKTVDALAVFAIVVLNAILGFIQEYRAENAIAALQSLSSPNVRVRRQSTVQEIPAEQLVPGDIILLEAGNTVPADARLIESASLRVQEAALTGESEAVEKEAGIISRPDTPLGDRRGMVFMGTAVTYGRGTAVIVETGMKTELGLVAGLISNIRAEPTPLQKRMAQLGRTLALTVLAIVVAAFSIGTFRGEDPILMFQTAISVAVAAVPEGLPAVVTIVLAMGAQRMLKRKALVRKLPAVETLGSVTVICSDKTGTLTENRMTVTVLDVAGNTLEFEEAVDRGKPYLLSSDQTINSQWESHFLLTGVGTLVNDAVLQGSDESCEDCKVIGDPTEAALLVAAARLGMWQQYLNGHFPRIGEVPFTSERRRMSTLHRQGSYQSMSMEDPTSKLSKLFPTPDSILLMAKGGVDSLLEVTDRLWVNGSIIALDQEWKDRILLANEKMAGRGLRVLGIAYRPIELEIKSNSDSMVEYPQEIESQLIFIGMIGMMDPPRQEVYQAVQNAKQAGIRPVMITGDHPLTALQIAKMLSIADQTDGRVLTGQDLSVMDDLQLRKAVREVSVFARVSPEQKLTIVDALQSQGEIVSMTGDGVNDAPALRKADIGVAMGITGTDVSKEASAMVILDDNFATIVSAVEEGRQVYDNVRKFIRYTLGSNAGELMVMFFSPLIGLPSPLIPLQILWMNLVTDGFPGLALTLEPPEKDIMRRQPISPDENVFARGLGWYILRIGVIMAIVTLGFAYLFWSRGNPAWTTMVFSLLIFAQAWHALAMRSVNQSLFSLKFSTNPLLYAAIGLTFALQFAAIYWPPLQRLFGTVPLGITDLLITFAVSLIIPLWIEGEKLISRRAQA